MSGGGYWKEDGKRVGMGHKLGVRIVGWEK